MSSELKSLIVHSGKNVDTTSTTEMPRTCRRTWHTFRLPSPVAGIHNETRKLYSPGTFSSRVQTFNNKDAVRFSRGYKLDQWWSAYGSFHPVPCWSSISTSTNFRRVAVCCRRQIQFNWLDLFVVPRNSWIPHHHVRLPIGIVDEA